MEVDIASQEEVVAKAEGEAVIASQGQIREAIRDFLDLKPDQPLRLDLKQTRRQVLGDFDPGRANLEEAQARDFEVRIKQLTQKLQAYNVTLAKMKFLPNFQFALQTPDPVSSTINRGTFFSVGLSFPIFDGFKRVRDIKRQNTILRQYASEEEVKAKELTQEWREAEEKLKTQGTTLKVAEAQAELARLKERQAETFYRRGEGDFSLFMTARQARVKAQKEAIAAKLEYDLAVLELRHLTGDLVYAYVHENQFRE
jgi:outer membrane protein TolC